MSYLRTKKYRNKICEGISRYPDWKYFLTIAYHSPITFEKAWFLTRKFLKKIVSKDKQILFVKLEGGSYKIGHQLHFHFHILIGDNGIRHKSASAIKSCLLETKDDLAMNAGYEWKSDSQISFDIQNSDYHQRLFDYSTKIQTNVRIPDNAHFLGEGGFRFWISPGFRNWWADFENTNQSFPIGNER